MKIKLLFIAFSIGLIGHEFIQMLLDAKHQFISIFFVVVLDFIFGVLKAFKLDNFETKKTFKALYVLTGFWFLLATVLTIEKGFPFADFLSEAILLPILLFQLISTLKNMNILGLIESDLLNSILSRIDKHKD
tara:strand:+ start:1036 stop:1434 length:399 start_codon:yes stop_codon:yes gene_type:complete